MVKMPGGFWWRIKKTTGDILEIFYAFRKDYFRHNAQDYRLLGMFSLQKDKFFEAIKYFKESIYLNPWDGITHAFLGLAYLNVGEYALAVSEFKYAINRDPNWSLKQDIPKFLEQALSKMQKE